MTANRTVIFIEGLPGCGKSTIAEWLGSSMKETGIFLEDAPGYPNDFSGLAGITCLQYEGLSARYPQLAQCSFPLADLMMVSLQGVKLLYPDEEELYRQLAEWEFADEFNSNIPLPHYQSCSLGMLRQWLSGPNQITKQHLVMDGSWLQNPVNELLYRNAGTTMVTDYTESVSRIFGRFNRKCIYLKRKDAAYSVWHACKTKGPAWTQRVAGHISRTPYGQVHQLSGLYGMIQFFGRRGILEELVLQRGVIPTLICDVESGDWAQVRERIREFIST